MKPALLSALVACWLMVQPLALLTQAIAPKAGNAQTAAAISPQTPEVPDADLLFRQGIAHYQANRFEAAIASWQSALEAYQQAQNLERVGAISNAIAAAHLKLSQYAAAATWAQQALTLAEAQNDVNAQAQSLGNLGIAYLEQGNYWQAIETYQRSLDLTPAALETPEAASETEAHLLGLLSNAYSALGDYDRAIALQTRSLEMAQSLGNSALEATALGNLGALHTTVGNYSTAIEYYQSGLRLAESIHDSTGIAYTLKNLGVAYHALNNVPQAIGYYQQSLIIARSLSQPQLEAAALTNLGIAYEDLGDYRQAIALHGESLAIARLSNDPQMVAQSLNNLGHAQLGANQLAEAAATLQQAIEILDRLRQHLSDLYTVSIFDTQVYTYNLLQQVLVAQADYARALEIAEQGRTRALVSLVANQQSAVTTVSVADIQALAREQQTTLVEYSAVPDDAFKFQGKQRGRISELFIWVIQPTGEISFRRQAISLEQPLESLIAQSRSQIGGRGIFRSIRVAPAQVTETGNPLQTLYEILIAPIQDLLPAAATDPVILIPHENLFLVPFAALQAADETYLIEHHTLAIAPQFSSWA
ncbi:MAG: tetratricopeptide repeat protein [Leptolyngbyaceae cyanobacterium SM1_1_3]|nr:tetratricopeptide repeat protein [Leptolyngbyaceae cyanobacterium SM1_1_3]